MKDFLKNLEKMQAEMVAAMRSIKAEGSAGGGMVKIEMDGEQNVQSIRIDAEVVKSGDVTMLQDLIRAAFTDAQQKVRDLMREHLVKKTGLPFPPPSA